MADQNLEKLHEGKAKVVYRIDGGPNLIQRFKDDATAFNGEKFAKFGGKGELNNRISSTLFRYLRAKGVESHYIDTLNTRDMLIRGVEIVPLEVVVRNIVAGSLAKRTGLEEGTPLPRTIVEFYYKRDDLGDPMLAREHIDVMGLATDAELATIREMAIAVNDNIRPLWAECGLELVDFKLEYGRVDGEILLADEISPDTSRLWPKEGGRKMDKDVFRRNLADLVETYQEVYELLESKFGEYTPKDLAQAASAS